MSERTIMAVVSDPEMERLKARVAGDAAEYAKKELHETFERRRAARNARKGWLYIVAEDVAPKENFGPVKIGVSVDPFSRLDSLQTGCPRGCLYIVRAFGFSDRKLAEEMERKFHKDHRNDRLHREWYNYTPDDGLEMLRQHIRRNISYYKPQITNLLWLESEDERTDLSEYV